MKEESIFSKFFNCFKRKTDNDKNSIDEDEENKEIEQEINEKEESMRFIYLDGKVFPPNKLKNSIRNQKYSIISFLPSILFEQFKFFFNLFFLMIALSQFFEPLKVGWKFFH